MLDARIYLPQEAINRFEIPKASIRSCERLLTYLSNKNLLDSSSIPLDELLKVISRSKILEFSSARILLSNGDSFLISPILLAYIDLSERTKEQSLNQIDQKESSDAPACTREEEKTNLLYYQTTNNCASPSVASMSHSDECKARIKKTQDLAHIFELNRKEVQFSSLKKNFSLTDEELINKLLSSPYLGKVFALDDEWLIAKLQEVRGTEQPIHANS